MDQLSSASGAALLVLLIAVAGCTPSEPKAAPTASEGMPGPTSLPSSVVAAPIGGEKVIFQLDSQRGGYSVDLPITSDRMNLYLRCIGTGVLQISIDEVAAYDYACTYGQDPGELDSFDVRYVDEIHLHIAPDTDQLWAATVTAVPLDG